MNHFARRSLVEPCTGIVDPISQTIAAKAGKAHKLDVLRVVPVAQVPDKAAERGCSHGVRQCVEGIGR